jgi:hypothetical protein
MHSQSIEFFASPAEMAVWLHFFHADGQKRQILTPGKTARKTR